MDQMDHIDRLTNDLICAIQNSEVFKDYQEARARIADDTNLQFRMKAFRKEQLDFYTKILQNIQPSFEEERHMSTLYTNILLNTHTSAFLQNEQKLLHLVAKIQNQISESCQIDSGL